MRQVIALVVGLIFLPLSGCATMIRGTTEPLHLNSTPQGATVTLSTGHSCVTPCQVVMDRDESFTVTFSMSGCEDEQVSVFPTLAGGGVLLGGLVDYGTGAVYSLRPNPAVATLNCPDTPVNIAKREYDEERPEEQAQKEPALTYADLVRTQPKATGYDTLEIQPAKASPGEPKGLQLTKGFLPWGASVAKAKQLHDKQGREYFKLSCFEDSQHETRCRRACCVDLGHKDTRYFASLRFYKDRFYEYTVEFHPSSFSLISPVFEKRLGRPDNDEQSIVQNRMGAEFDQHEKQWGTRNTTVRISKRAGKVTEGQFVVTYLPIAEEIEVPLPSKAPF